MIGASRRRRDYMNNTHRPAVELQSSWCGDMPLLRLERRPAPPQGRNHWSEPRNKKNLPSAHSEEHDRLWLPVRGYQPVATAIPYKCWNWELPGFPPIAPCLNRCGPEVLPLDLLRTERGRKVPQILFPGMPPGHQVLAAPSAYPRQESTICS